MEPFWRTRAVPDGGIRPLREVGFGGAGWSWELQLLESPTPISDSKLGRGVFPSRGSALLEEVFWSCMVRFGAPGEKNKTPNS